MRDSAAKQLLAEILRRRPVEESDQVAKAHDAAAKLRAWYYPKQRAFYTSKGSKRRATKKTRRAGATAGGCREFLARCIETPGFRGTYVTSTKQEARERAWTNDTNSGFLDVLRSEGALVHHPGRNEAYKFGGVKFVVHDMKMILEADDGRRINLFGADDERSLRKQRGLAKHIYWIDEAQDFRFLDKFYDAVISASLVDYDGECWLTGTPGKDPSGMFYDVTKDDEDDGPRLPGWEVHTFAVVDNPFFGHVIGGPSLAGGGNIQYLIEDNMGNRTGPYSSFADAEKAAEGVRWDRTAGEAIKQHGWSGTEPDLRREWYGQWVKEDARYVYPVNAVPVHKLIYAPQRPAPNPFVGTDPRFDGHPAWFDFKRSYNDLPKELRNVRWLYAVGVDFGYSPDPFALTVWAFSQDLPDVYEMFSWKCARVHTDDQGAYMKLLWDTLDNVVIFVGDPAGKQDDFEMWRTRMNLPITEANKRGKSTLEEFLADDIRRHRVHLRMNSPLHMEMKHLIYLPTKPGAPRQVAKHRKTSDGIVHGDHNCDAARYAYTALTHFLSKEPKSKPDPMSEAGLRAKEQEYEKRIDLEEQRRAERLARGDEETEDYNDYEY